MSGNNGNSRLDRLEQIMLDLATQVQAQADINAQTVKVVNRLSGIVADLARAVESLEHSQKQLLTSQVLMQDRMDTFDKRMSDFVSAFGAYLRKQDAK